MLAVRHLFCLREMRITGAFLVGTPHGGRQRSRLSCSFGHRLRRPGDRLRARRDVARTRSLVQAPSPASSGVSLPVRESTWSRLPPPFRDGPGSCTFPCQHLPHVEPRVSAILMEVRASEGGPLSRPELVVATHQLTNLVNWSSSPCTGTAWSPSRQPCP